MNLKWNYGQGVLVLPSSVLSADASPEQLREYLNLSGFSIVGESYCSEGGKSYNVLAVEYTGKNPDTCSERVRYGVVCREFSREQTEYLSVKLKSKKRAAAGIFAAGIEDSVLIKDIEYIEGLLAELSELSGEAV